MKSILRFFKLFVTKSDSITKTRARQLAVGDLIENNFQNVYSTPELRTDKKYWKDRNNSQGNLKVIKTKLNKHGMIKIETVDEKNTPHWIQVHGRHKIKPVFQIKK